MKPGMVLFIVLVIIAHSGPPVSLPVAAHAPAGDLTVFHRSGQTFLTWPEVAGAPTMTYRVYRHNAPIDQAVLSSAELVAEAPQGSGIFWTEHARALGPLSDEGNYVSLNTYIIDDLGSPLPDGTGLFVWTTHTGGDAYYAVLSADEALFVTAGPVAEQVSEPAPVLVWQSADGLGRVYTQFMDYAAYNPTFDAPSESNSWMGLPDWQALERMVPQQQYAYNYWVGLPAPENCGGTVPDQLPLVLHIEGHGTRYTVLESAPYWCAVMIWGDDPNQSWYFGFSSTHDYRTPMPVTAGPIVNYTEERLLRAVREVVTGPGQPSIDPNRVYVYGHSMGGTGALALAERYPNVFAAASASEPMMNFAASSMWIDELENKWGARDLNLPVELRGPDSAPLSRYQGTGVWDWQNLGDQLAARRGDEMAFITVAHGTQDIVIDWQTVAQPAYANFYTGRRAFMAEIVPADHTWLGFREHPDWPFDLMTFRRDETFPALTYASDSLGVPPDGVGGYNTTLEWSSSWHAFAGAPIDTPQQWAVVLRSMTGDQTVDVTPRRVRQFVITPGAVFDWQNIRLDNYAIVQQGTVTADADGLITVEGVSVSPGGNQLVVRAP